MTKEFVKGLILKEIETQYGSMISVSVNKDSFNENLFNEKGWLNFTIKKGKDSNKYYAEVYSRKEENV
jgi:hypothetical protein